MSELILLFLFTQIHTTR